MGDIVNGNLTGKIPLRLYERMLVRFRALLQEYTHQKGDRPRRIWLYPRVWLISGRH